MIRHRLCSACANPDGVQSCIKLGRPKTSRRGLQVVFVYSV